MQSLLKEFRRRNVFRIAIAYLVLGWVVVQIASILAPAMYLPEWTLSLVIFVGLIGFPFALLFAWAYELTPDGLRPTGAFEAETSVTKATGQKLNFLIITLLALALTATVLDAYVLDDETIMASEEELPTSRSSIAVLPFVNMSSDEDQVYFSDGISEEILNVLAQIPNLHVTSRSSAFQFRGGEIHIPTVAKQLGVANVLEGSVRKSGTRIRITAQLIDAANDNHLWSETYDRELTDIFKIQDEISAAIVDALHVHLGLEQPKPKPVQEVDLEAYGLYLLGRRNFEMRTGERLKEAISNFEEAIAIAPDHAPSYAGKADAYLLLNSYGDLSLSQSLAKAEPLIKKALDLDPDLAEAHTSRGFALRERGQLEASLEAFNTSIALNPNLTRAWHWRAITLGRLLRFPEELESWEQAHRVDPLSPQIITVLGQKFLDFDRLEDARKLRQNLSIIAPGSEWFYNLSMMIFQQEGEWAECIKVLTPLNELNTTQNIQNNLHIYRHFLRAYDAAASTLSTSRQLSLDSIADPQAAWALFNALSEDGRNDPRNMMNAIRAGTILGKYDEVVHLVERQVNLDETVTGPLFDTNTQLGSAALFLVVSRRQSGDHEGAQRLITAFEKMIAAKAEMDTVGLQAVFEAKVHALKGEDGEAISDLKSALSANAIGWFMLEWPMFDTIRSRDDFQEIVRLVDVKVNKERAKLGWKPFD